MMRTTSAKGVGIALTPELYGEVSRDDGGTFDFLELDPDVYHLTDAVEATLAELTERYPMLLHSTRLSICGDNELDKYAVAKTRRFAEITQCDFYSDHLSYTWSGSTNLDLYMPPVFSDEMVDYLRRRVEAVRAQVPCDFVLENVGMLVAQPGSPYSEVDFIAKVIDATGIGLQLNLDSVAISATTHGESPEAYLKLFDLSEVAMVTVVPESSMNPILRKRYGSGIDDLMLRMLGYVLDHSDVDRFMIQGRRGDIKEDFLEFYRVARSTYYEAR